MQIGRCLENSLALQALWSLPIYQQGVYSSASPTKSKSMYLFSHDAFPQRGRASRGL